MGAKAAHGVLFCKKIFSMIAENEDETKPSRIDKVIELRDKITTSTDRVHNSNQRVIVLHKLYD